MLETLVFALGIRMMLKMLGFAVLAIAIVAWFIGWIRDKVA